MIPKVRTRFAPSPTGAMHIGGIRTALFNWLYARHTGGTFILRIEDTDRERSTDESLASILDALAWYDLTPDEGPSVRSLSEQDTYIQSSRKKLYTDAAQTLIENGKAYYCFCSEERLTELREQAALLKQPPRYDRACRSIPSDDARKRAETDPHVIRAAIPEKGTVAMHDEVYGDIFVEWSTIDDQILIKSDGFPTYHLANVVDDHDMTITHVIRGEEWLPSLPKHLFLYDAFGWKAPVFVHLPLIYGHDRKKLSKRHGALPAIDYRDHGYLPGAIINGIALLGWNPKTDQEIFSRDELVAAFDFPGINTSNPIFDPQKLDWVNGKHLRALSPEAIADLARPFLSDQWDENAVPLASAVGLVRDRVVHLTDIEERIAFLAHIPDYEPKLLMPKGESDARVVRNALTVIHDTWSTVDDWSEGILERTAMGIVEKGEYTTRALLWPTRVALSGQKASPGVFEIARVLGKAEALKRIKNAAGKLES